MTAVHRAIIDELLALGAVEGGFREAVEAATGMRFEAAPLMWPDAYLIQPALSVVNLFEVEITHAMDDKRKAKVTAWAVWLSGQGWMLRVFCYDRRRQRYELDPITMELTAAEKARSREILESLDRPIEEWWARYPELRPVTR